MCQEACGAELRSGVAEAIGCQVNHELGIYFIGDGASLQERDLVEFAFGALTVKAVAGGTGGQAVLQAQSREHGEEMKTMSGFRAGHRSAQKAEVTD